MRSRRGFTLAEVLVVLAILAVLGAVLIPTILNQIRKGQVGRVVGDLDAARAAIESFVGDVQRFPSELDHLTTAIAISDTDILGSTYPQGLVNKWDGPYMNKVPVNNAIVTGFGGMIQNTLKSNTNSNSVNYVTVLITGLAEQDFDEIDAVIDGTADSSSGNLRFTALGDDTVKYMLVPIN